MTQAYLPVTVTAEYLDGVMNEVVQVNLRPCYPGGETDSWVPVRRDRLIFGPLLPGLDAPEQMGLAV